MTQEELEKLSDEEINLKVYLALHEDLPAFEFIGIHADDAPNYCEIPNLIMPLAIENRMHMQPRGMGLYKVSCDAPVTHYTFWTENKNIFRAIAIVYLLIKEIENNV